MSNNRFYKAATIIVILLVAAFSSIPFAGSNAAIEGRNVDFGFWNGIVKCEASPNNAHGTPHLVLEHHPEKRAREVRADSIGHSPDKGIVQFIQSTWDSVALARGKGRLVGKDPRSFTLATQMRQAQYLRKNVSIRQWSCYRSYYNGTKARWVTGEWKLPKNPERCARNLHKHHGFKLKMADSICNYDRP